MEEKEGMMEKEGKGCMWHKEQEGGVKDNNRIKS